MIHLDLRYIEFAMHRVQYAVFLQILLVKKNYIVAQLSRQKSEIFIMN